MPHHVDWITRDLPSGGELRLAGPTPVDGGSGRAVVFASGGGNLHAPGTWSSNYAWLLPRLLHHGDLEGVRVGWVRYADRSWSAVASSTRDIDAAVQVLVDEGATDVTLVGFSMGAGAALPVAARRPEVTELVGLAPWFPQAQFAPLARSGAKLRVLHGTRDGSYAMLPGVPARHSRAAVEAAKRSGVDATWTPIPGGVHGWSVGGAGRPLRLPKAATWLREIRATLAAH